MKKDKWVVREMIDGKRLAAELNKFDEEGFDIFDLFPTGEWFTVVARYAPSQVPLPHFAPKTKQKKNET